MTPKDREVLKIGLFFFLSLVFLPSILKPLSVITIVFFLMGLGLLAVAISETYRFNKREWTDEESGKNRS